MPEPPGYRFENVWRDKSAGLREEIKQFWAQFNALPERADVEVRLDQVLFLVRTDDGDIGGVGSTYLGYDSQLLNWFYYYRTFIAPRLRRSYVAKELLEKTQQFLELYAEHDPLNRALGMVLELEADSLKAGGITVKRAVWRDTGFVFIGVNNLGAHRRVYYFPGALIEKTDPF